MKEVYVIGSQKKLKFILIYSLFKIDLDRLNLLQISGNYVPVQGNKSTSILKAKH